MAICAFSLLSALWVTSGRGVSKFRRVLRFTSTVSSARTPCGASPSCAHLRKAAVHFCCRTRHCAQPRFGNARRIQYLGSNLLDFPGLRRFSLILIGSFSLAALLLAVVGVYGVTSYSVTRRVREIGIRMALGASASQILSMILLQTAATSAIGVSLGTLGSAALTRWIQSQLFGVSPLDPVIFVAVALLMLLVAQLAGLIPSRRASRVDPAVALRYE